MREPFEEFRFTKRMRVDQPASPVTYDDSFVLAFGNRNVLVATQAGETIKDVKASSLADVQSLYAVIFGRRPPLECRIHHLVLDCFVEGRVRGWW